MDGDRKRRIKANKRKLATMNAHEIAAKVTNYQDEIRKLNVVVDQYSEYLAQLLGIEPSEVKRMMKEQRQ